MSLNKARLSVPKYTVSGRFNITFKWPLSDITANYLPLEKSLYYYNTSEISHAQMYQNHCIEVEGHSDDT